MKYFILWIGILGLSASLYAQPNSDQLVDRYGVLLDSAEQLIATDTMGAAQLVDEVQLHKLSDTHPKFRKLAIAKLKLLGSHFDREKFDAEVSSLKRQLVEEENDSSLAEILSFLSDYYLNTGEYDLSYSQALKALQVFEKLGDKEKMGQLLLKKSVIEYSQGKYLQSIENTFKAIEYFEQTDENKQLAFSYLQIGSTYLYINYLEEAQSNYETAAQMFLEMQDTLGAAICEANIALIEMEHRNYDRAIQLLKKSKPVIQQSNRQIMIGFSIQALGECYLAKSDLDSAQYFAQKALAINQKIGYPTGIAKDLYVLSKIKQEAGDLDSSLVLGLSSLAILDENPDYEIDLLLSLLLADLYKERQQFDKSTEFLSRHLTVRDSVDEEKGYLEELSHNENKKLVETKYQLQLAKASEKTTLEKNAYQTRIIALLILFVVVLIASIIYFLFSNRNIKQLNKKLTKELDRNNALIKEVHHRVKNNLQMVASLLSIQSTHSDNQALKDTLSDSRHRINSIALIHESLYKKEDNNAPYFSEYVRQLVPLLLNTYHYNPDQIELQLELDDFYLSWEESIPAGLIINEVVTNSIKHAFSDMEQGIIHIRMKKLGERIELYIDDNGKGLADDFDRAKVGSFGMLLIETFAEQLFAELRIESKGGLQVYLSWKTEAV